MIVEISVENIAVIEKAQLSLGPGLTVLTGETGAGKSLLVDAIQLALGDRADSDLVRSGAPRASVSAVFDLSSSSSLLEHSEVAGLTLEFGCLYVQREVSAEGRSQCRVGGKLAPVSGLRSLGALLVDMHGQHDHQSLLHPELHLGFLDSAIGDEAHALRQRVASSYADWEDAKRRLAALSQNVRDREQRIDLLAYQVEEIESIAPQVGEMADLEAQLSRLQHVEKLKLASFGALDRLGGDEGGALERLGVSVRELEASQQIDPSLDEPLESLRQSLYSLDECLRSLRSYADALESDPQALETTMERIEALRKLRRKYGDDEESVLRYLEEARSELAMLHEVEADEGELAARVESKKQVLDGLAQELTALRLSHSAQFANTVENELRELAIDKAKFVVKIEPKAVDADGADRVEFYFSANVGESERPLAKIASGGEVSRVMLAIKTVLAGKAGVPTLIFDEVDAGLSGRAAAVVGRKLEQLGQHYQVIAISHLPQIASRARTHIRIEKTESGGRVSTTLRALQGEERVREVARMLAGETIGETALLNARELIGEVPPG